MLTIWSNPHEMKSTNCISRTGRIPWIASPTPAPTMRVSEMGVSTTRSEPNRSSSPSLALNAPPRIPTSSPRSITVSSLSISSCIAWLIAWM